MRTSTTRWMRRTTQAATVALLLASAGVAHAQAPAEAAPQPATTSLAITTDTSTAVQPYYALVTTDNTSARTGASERFYAVANLAAGTLVVVDGESGGWARVLFPQGASGYVRAEDVRVENNVATLRNESRLLAWGPIPRAQSWAALLTRPLESGARLTVLEEIKEGQTPVGYRIEAPSQARAFIAASRLRRATSTEVAGLQSKGVSVPVLPEWTGPTTTTTSTTPTTTPTTTTTTTTTASPTAPAPDASGAVIPTDPTTATAGTVGEAPALPVTGALTPDADRTPETLEAIFRRVWAEPVMTSEVDELIAQYTDAIAKVPADQTRRKAALEQRLEALRVRREFRDSMRRQQAEAQQLSASDQELQAAVRRWEESRVYNIVGVLQASTVYDGQRLPAMYRIVSTGPGSRTLGYIRRDANGQLDSMLGQVVGVIGESNLDRSLMLNMIAPVRVDPLRAAPEAGSVNLGSTPANVPSGGN